MFSFHKPRIYRSASGCCICRAKSSSSRFTDSRRYEGDFYACFKLGECRTGDICNACVLLVKRWKKLPKGSQRNWHHVVDARAGHGSKPISKINKVKKPAIAVITKMKPAAGMDISDKMRNVMKKHINPSESYITSLGRNRAHSPSGCSDDVQMDCISSESGSYHSSLAASPTPSDVGDEDVSVNNFARNNKKVKVATDTVHLLSHQNSANTSNNGNTTNNNSKVKRGKDTCQKSRRNSDASHSSFLDLSFWKREKTCCGIIFKGPCGEVLLDRRFLSPCFLRSVKRNSSSVGCSHSENQLKQKPVQLPVKSETCVSGGGTDELPGGGTFNKDPSTGSSKDTSIPVDCISVDSGYDDSSNPTPDAFKPQLAGGGISTVVGGSCIVVGKPVHSSLPASYESSVGPLKTTSSSLVTSTVVGEQSIVVVSAETKPMDSSVTSTIQCGVPPIISQN